MSVESVLKRYPYQKDVVCIRDESELDVRIGEASLPKGVLLEKRLNQKDVYIRAMSVSGVRGEY